MTYAASTHRQDRTRAASSAGAYAGAVNHAGQSLADLIAGNVPRGSMTRPGGSMDTTVCRKCIGMSMGTWSESLHGPSGTCLAGMPCSNPSEHHKPEPYQEHDYLIVCQRCGHQGDTFSEMDHKECTGVPA